MPVLPLLGKSVSRTDGEPGRAQLFYHSVPVAAGDMLVFGHNVPHYAPGCYTRHAQRQERIALYDMKSDSPELEQDDFPADAEQFMEEAAREEETHNGANKPKSKRTRRK